MRRYRLVWLTLLLSGGGYADPGVQVRPVALGEIVFEQAADQHSFLGRSPEGQLLVTPDGFAVGKRESVVRVQFGGGDPDARVSGRQPLASRSHYLRGRNSKSWRQGVRHYRRARATNIYAGIDVEFYQGPEGLEFDLLVGPGAEPGGVRMAFEGATAVRVAEDGALECETAAGTLRQLPPRVFQTIADERREIPADYVLLADGTVGFQLGPYDRREPLVIDPVIEWATFLGGSGQEQVNAVAVDAQGFVYVGGFTTSANFPTVNPRDGQMDGAIDGFVSKLSPDGTELIWSTYLGGSLRDEIRGLQVDAQGNVYVSGPTESSDFPTTNGAAQTTLAGPVDAFVSKLSPTGDDFVYSTLFGGPGAENGKRLDIDSSGGVYLAGEIGSGDLPATAGAFQTTFGGASDVFVAKIGPAGSAVEWASYFGGNGIDQLFDVETDPSGGVIVAGAANSSDLQGTENAFQRTRPGNMDGFIARFSADGSAVDYFTFLGGSFVDSIRGIALDGSGNIWAAGGTASNDLPVTSDAANPTYAGSGTDGFLARLPMPSRIVPGPPVVAPYVSYVGDEITNFGLDVAISRSPASALSAEGVQQAFGEFSVFYSLSNFTDADGSFNKIIQLGPDGRPINTVTLPGADTNASAADPRGAGVVFGGVGLQNGQTTPGTVQPIFGGGTGTLPADAFVVRTAPPIAGTDARLTIAKTVARPSSAQIPTAPLAVGERVFFDVVVANDGSIDARDVVVSDEGSNLFFPGPLAPIPGSGALFDAASCTFSPDIPPKDAVTCRLPFLAPGARFGFRVLANTVQTGQLLNSASATASNAPTVSAAIGRTVANTQLEVTKVLVDPMQGPVEPLDVVRHLVTVKNVGQVDAVDVGVLDSPSGRALDVNIETNASGTVCEVVQRTGNERGQVQEPLLLRLRAFRGDVICGRGILSPGDSFSFSVAARVPLSGALFSNRARAEARNAFPSVASLAIPVGNEPAEDEILCQANSAGGSGAADVGADNLKAALPPVDTTCWVRDQPNNGVLPIQVSADMGIDPANQINPDGTYSGMGVVVIGEDGRPIEVPVRPGPAPGTVQTDTFDAPVRNNTLGMSFSGFRINATELSGPTNILPGFEINTPNGRVPVGAPLQLVPQKEIAPMLRFLPGDHPSFIDLSARVGVGVTSGGEGQASFPDAAFDTEVFTIFRLDGLPSNATARPMPGCVFLTPPPSEQGTLRSLETFFDPWLQHVPGADQNGMGGEPTEDCASFTPEIVDGSITTTWRMRSLLGSIAEGLVEFLLSFGLEGGQFGNTTVTVGLGPYLPDGADPADFPAPLYQRPEPIAFSITAPTPAVTGAGVVSAASNLTLSHGLGAVFGGNLANGTGAATTLPLSNDVNGSQVYVLPVPDEDFAGLSPEAKAGGPPRTEQSGGYFAPLLFVSPAQINFQLPWEVDLSSGFVDLQVIRNGVPSDIVRVAVSEFSPAVFSFDFGPGRAIAINPDGSVAHPADSFGGAVASRPVQRGEALIILASGLGPVTPPGVTGANSLDAAGNFVRRDTVQIPRVTIGGVEQQVAFSGLSPEFAGVYQLNVIVDEATPAGDQQPLILEAGGVRSRDDVIVAVAP